MRKAVNTIYMPILLFLISVVSTQAQDLKSDLERARKLMDNPASFYTKMKARIEYVDEFKEDNNILKEVNTVIRISKGNYFLENEMTSMLINEKWVIGVIHPMRQIIYGRNTPEQFEKVQKKMIEKNFSLPLVINGDVSVLDMAGNSIKYRVSGKNYGLEYTEVHLDKVTHFFKRIENVYSAPYPVGVMKTVTEFIEFDNSIPFGPDTFSESQFIIFGGSEAKPSAKYKNYQLVYSDVELLKSF